MDRLQEDLKTLCNELKDTSRTATTALEAVDEKRMAYCLVLALQVSSLGMAVKAFSMSAQAEIEKKGEEAGHV